MFNEFSFSIKNVLTALLMMCVAENTSAQTPLAEMVIELDHKVKKGETLYAIGKYYHCSVSELQALNPGVGMLKPGMKVRVKQRTKMPAKSANVITPQLNPVAERNIEQPPVAIASNIAQAPENVFDHLVEKGQSLFSISKKYGVSVAEIKKINTLTSDQLSINQKLWIPKNLSLGQNVLALGDSAALIEIPAQTAVVVGASVNAVNATGAATDITGALPNATVILPGSTAKMQGLSIKDSMEKQVGMPEQIQTPLKTSNLKEYEKKVTAQIGYEGMKADRSWVMINKHKKGEVIAVINPENKKMVYCTVIGEIAEKGNKQIAISQSVADRLGITQSNATLRVRYVAQ